MNLNESIAEFRSLLNEPPGDALRAKIWEKLPDDPPPELIEYIQGHLSHWPPHILRVARRGWWQQVAEDAPLSPMVLCNHTSKELGAESTWPAHRDLTGLTSCQLTIKDQGAWAKLIDSPSLSNLRTLRVRNGQCTDEHAAALADWSGLATLETLQLSFCGLTDVGLDHITSSPHVKNIQHLQIAGNQITKEGIEALASSRTLTSLKALDLRHNVIGEEGARALAESPLAAQLTWVQVYKEDVTGRGYKAMASSERFPLALRAYFRGKHP